MFGLIGLLFEAIGCFKGKKILQLNPDVLLQLNFLPPWGAPWGNLFF